MIYVHRGWFLILMVVAVVVLVSLINLSTQGTCTQLAGMMDAGQLSRMPLEWNIFSGCMMQLPNGHWIAP